MNKEEEFGLVLCGAFGLAFGVIFLAVIIGYIFNVSADLVLFLGVVFGIPTIGCGFILKGVWNEDDKEVIEQ